jgi:hypothetical protein
VSAVSGEGVTALLRTAFAEVRGEKVPETATEAGWRP